ncbi:hypothetical protein BDA96_02G325600 [Sorghum bicolor]|uniref:Uncharacterized protein n=2 Tax=Sorghum bicolor TaxID=4558 RepID=A0A921RSF2_SORBI|nr:hypothetical protein BDA96_02G325600 [Sorghum bicolor]KXG36271.1 hypothetical protein SORBI_3002G310100 [Sorghum bicolor]
MDHNSIDTAVVARMVQRILNWMKEFAPSTILEMDVGEI